MQGGTSTSGWDAVIARVIVALVCVACPRAVRNLSAGGGATYRIILFVPVPLAFVVALVVGNTSRSDGVGHELLTYVAAFILGFFIDVVLEPAEHVRQVDPVQQRDEAGRSPLQALQQHRRLLVLEEEKRQVEAEKKQVETRAEQVEVLAARLATEKAEAEIEKQLAQLEAVQLAEQLAAEKQRAEAKIARLAAEKEELAARHKKAGERVLTFIDRMHEVEIQNEKLEEQLVHAEERVDQLVGEKERVQYDLRLAERAASSLGSSSSSGSKRVRWARTTRPGRSNRSTCSDPSPASRKWVAVPRRAGSCPARIPPAGDSSAALSTYQPLFTRTRPLVLNDQEPGATL